MSTRTRLLTHRIGLNLSPDLVEWLQAEAFRRRMPLSFVIRDLINDAMVASQHKEKD